MVLVDRRRVLAGSSIAAGVWVAPVVLGLDRAAAASPSAGYAAVYTEDFQGAIGGPNVGWSTTLTETAPADPGRRFLGRFGNQTATLRMRDLPPHECVCVTFDFYCIESWDGHHPTWGGPDEFGVRIDGVEEMRDSFSYWRFGTRPDGADFEQTYGPAAFNPAGTGTVERDTLGYNRWGNQVFRISVCDIAHVSSSISIDFFGSGLQALNDESWGIDNVVIEVG